MIRSGKQEIEVAAISDPHMYSFHALINNKMDREDTAAFILGRIMPNSICISLLNSIHAASINAFGKD